jgi:hypothetical protein
MKAKQISNRQDEEQQAFKSILERFDYETDKVLSFFSGLLTRHDLKDPRDIMYKRIAEKMLPLDA